MSKTLSWAMEGLPSFRGIKVFVLPGPGYAQVVSLFCGMGAKRAPTYLDAELVVFLGGTDVSPRLYNEKPVEEVRHVDVERDAREQTVFNACKAKGIAMFGICRGAQFLHVMNGGSLWQHTDNHAGEHLIYDIDEDVLVTASSTHHQMMKFNDDMVLLAVTDEPVASFVKNEEKIVDVADAHVIEVEACYYDVTKCLCIQGHPEWGPAPFTSWAFHKLHELMVCGWDVYDHFTSKKETA
jgi:gamma-glutamyl-gamma-aminobutyrate hydrolase PuuD